MLLIEATLECPVQWWPASAALRHRLWCPLEPCSTFTSVWSNVFGVAFKEQSHSSPCGVGSIEHDLKVEPLISLLQIV